jgi:hypothetical protein
LFTFGVGNFSTLFAFNTKPKQKMRTITFENKKINFDFSLGCINDVYVKELGGDFNDLVNIQEYQDNPSKLLDVTRDMMLSGHIYWLYCNDKEEDADILLTKLKSTRMIATKWLIKTQVMTVVEWLTKDLMPSDLEVPVEKQIKKKSS